MRLKPIQVYNAIVNMETHVRRRHTIPQWRSWRPRGGEAIRPPADLSRWLRSANEDDVLEFWHLLSVGKWRKAKRMAKISDKTVTFLLETMWNDRVATSGSASPEKYTLFGIPLGFVFEAIRSLPDDDISAIDEYRYAPEPVSWPRVRRAAKKSFAKLTDALNELLEVKPWKK